MIQAQRPAPIFFAKTATEEQQEDPVSIGIGLFELWRFGAELGDQMFVRQFVELARFFHQTDGEKRVQVRHFELAVVMESVATKERSSLAPH